MTNYAENTQDALRKWAKGTYPEEAAVEMLIRGHGGRFAQPGNAWIVPDNDKAPGAYWVDWRDIEDNIGALSGGERRFMLLAASLGGHGQVNLSDVITGNDRFTTELLLAAISHGAGTHEGGRVRLDQRGRPFFEAITTPLHPWPEEEG